MLETQLAPAYDLQGGLGRSRWAGSLALGCASSESWEESSPSRAFSTLDSGSLLGDTALWGPVLVTTVGAASQHGVCEEQGSAQHPGEQISPESWQMSLRYTEHMQRLQGGD